jgi:hypothetical protein
VTPPRRQTRLPPAGPGALPARPVTRTTRPGRTRPALCKSARTATATPSQPLKPNPEPDPEVAIMTLTINDTIMTSDQTAHTARQAPGRKPSWEVSWLPGQTLDRNTAITAMILADTAAQAGLHEGHRLWPHIQGWAAELGLTAPDAIMQVTQPPRDTNRHQEPASGEPDPEAAD